MKSYGMSNLNSYCIVLFRFLCISAHSGSHVYGSIIKGVFSGTIHLLDDTFHIEKAEMYIPGAPFHSVIYSEKHMDINPPLV